MRKKPLYRLPVKSLTISIFFILFLFSVFVPFGLAQQEEISTDAACVAYITGIGCHNCAVADPAIFVDFLARNPRATVIEYEIYKAREYNSTIKDQYFLNYWGPSNAGVPFLILGKNNTAMGRFKVADLAATLTEEQTNPCPLPDGSASAFESLDIANLPGKVNIWTKDRILMTTKGGGDNDVLRNILIQEDVRAALEGVKLELITPIPVRISENNIVFKNAVQIGNWTLQWSGEPLILSNGIGRYFKDYFLWVLIGILAFLVVLSLVKPERTPRGLEIRLRKIEKKRKDYIVIAVALVVIAVFFAYAKNISPDALQKMGYHLPLGLFTFLIAIVDGFNPCNMFVLTCLMALLISTSDSRLRLYIVGLSFVFMVFLIYFLFMAAWLNVFQYLSFVTPLRIGIAFMALVAGVINCKELLFFKKGISLTIPDQQRGPLMKKVYAMKEIIQKGSFPVLILSSLALAALSSLVELPCTAGFPIIYTGILSGKVLETSLAYYGYLVVYNIFYVLPLLVIISVFIFTFKGQPVSQRQMEILKFVGGLIMIILGIVLLVNPGLVGLGVG